MGAMETGAGLDARKAEVRRFLSRSWPLGDGRIMCAACGHRTSVTAGTILNGTRKPLTVITTAARSRHSADAVDIG